MIPNYGTFKNPEEEEEIPQFLLIGELNFFLSLKLREPEPEGEDPFDLLLESFKELSEKKKASRESEYQNQRNELFASKRLDVLIDNITPRWSLDNFIALSPEFVRLKPYWGNYITFQCDPFKELEKELNIYSDTPKTGFSVVRRKTKHSRPLSYEEFIRLCEATEPSKRASGGSSSDEIWFVLGDEEYKPDSDYDLFMHL
jgi:hypothetical protein